MSSARKNKNKKKNKYCKMPASRCRPPPPDPHGSWRGRATVAFHRHCRRIQEGSIRPPRARHNRQIHVDPGGPPLLPSTRRVLAGLCRHAPTRRPPPHTRERERGESSRRERVWGRERRRRKERRGDKEVRRDRGNDLKKFKMLKRGKEVTHTSGWTFKRSVGKNIFFQCGHLRGLSKEIALFLHTTP